MFDPTPISNNHQIKAQVTFVADLARVCFKGTGDAVLLPWGNGMQGGCAISAIFDLNRDHDISASGDDVDFTDRAFVADGQNAIALEPQPEFTKFFRPASSLFRPLAA